MTFSRPSARSTSAWGFQIGLRRAVLGNQHPQVAVSLEQLARLLARQGRIAEAETLSAEAAAIQSQAQPAIPVRLAKAAK